MFKKVGRLFRCCPVCGRSFYPMDWLCLYCYGKLFDRLMPTHQLIHATLNHYYLFAWYPEDLFISKVVYSLKGGGLDSTFAVLVKLMLEHFPHSHIDQIYYPSKGSKDHAYQLAHFLAGKQKLAVLPIDIQKGLKQARMERKKRLTQVFKKVGHSSKNPLLIDDIVTSGGTALACHKALGQPKNLTVWSLFYRKSL